MTSFATSRLFGPVVPELGWAPPLRYLLRRDRVLRMLQKVPSGSLLEIGCGSGALLHELAQCGHRAVGLETSASAARMAREIARLGRGTQVIHEAPADDWEGQFDLVCAFDVLEHIEDDAGALDQWLAWLRPRGHLCISVPAHPHRWGAGDKWAGHYRRYERGKLQDLLREKGLLLERFECYGFPLANLTEFVGNRSYRKLLRDRGRPYSHREASASSGIDRQAYLRMFHMIDTLVGRNALRLANVVQGATVATNLGSGYLALGRLT